MPAELEGFPRRLRLLMQAEGLSTRDLAKRTKGRVSHSAIAQWLSGENRATLEQVEHVAKVFDWDAHELLYGRATPDTVDRLAELDASLRRIRKALAVAAMAADLIAGTKAADLDAGDEPSSRTG